MPNDATSHLPLDLTAHAEARLRQRGIPREVAALVRDRHDIAVPVGRGCVALSLSHRAVQDLLADGVPLRLAEGTRAVAIVADAATGLVVTAMHLRGRSGRRYTRRVHDRRGGAWRPGRGGAGPAGGRR